MVNRLTADFVFATGKKLKLTFRLLHRISRIFLPRFCGGESKEGEGGKGCDGEEGRETILSLPRQSHLQPLSKIPPAWEIKEGDRLYTGDT